MHAFNKIEEGNPIKCFREVSSKITGHVLSNEKTTEKKKNKKEVNCVCSFHNENYRHSHQSVAQIPILSCVRGHGLSL